MMMFDRSINVRVQWPAGGLRYSEVRLLLRCWRESRRAPSALMIKPRRRPCREPGEVRAEQAYDIGELVPRIEIVRDAVVIEDHAAHSFRFSGGLPPPPPAEKATASQVHFGQKRKAQDQHISSPCR
jgi:hypothetical protein